MRTWHSKDEKLEPGQTINYTRTLNANWEVTGGFNGYTYEGTYKSTGKKPGEFGDVSVKVDLAPDTLAVTGFTLSAKGARYNSDGKLITFDNELTGIPGNLSIPMEHGEIATDESLYYRLKGFNTQNYFNQPIKYKRIYEDGTWDEMRRIESNDDDCILSISFHKPLP